jgi:hypothetical protein
MHSSRKFVYQLSVCSGAEEKNTESPDLVWPDYFQPAVSLNSEIHLNRISYIN